MSDFRFSSDAAREVAEKIEAALCDVQNNCQGGSMTSNTRNGMRLTALELMAEYRPRLSSEQCIEVKRWFEESYEISLEDS